jgi:hypothetical protein
LTPSTRVAIATLVATPPRLSLSEHGQRARGRRQANPAATICWSPYSSPLTPAAMDAGLPPPLPLLPEPRGAANSVPGVGKTAGWTG